MIHKSLVAYTDIWLLSSDKYPAVARAKVINDQAEEVYVDIYFYYTTKQVAEALIKKLTFWQDGLVDLLTRSKISTAHFMTEYERHKENLPIQMDLIPDTKNVALTYKFPHFEVNELLKDIERAIQRYQELIEKIDNLGKEEPSESEE